jgi:hypothetical protein
MRDSIYKRIASNAGPVSHDWFSDAVTSGLSAVGIDQATRDAVQPYVPSTASVVNSAKGLLPANGIYPASTAIGSKPQATGFKNISPMMIGLGLAAIVVLLYVSKGK